VPRKLKIAFVEAGQDCTTVPEAGFSGKENGELLALANEIFEALVTVDKNIRHQQSIPRLNLALIVIRAVSNDLDDIRPHISAALRPWKPSSPAALLKLVLVLEINSGSFEGLRSTTTTSVILIC